MKIEKTSSPVFWNDHPELFPHENDVREGFMYLMSRNRLRLNHCSRYPEDLGTDYVIEYIMFYLEKKKEIPKDELEAVRKTLDSGFASDLVENLYSKVREKEKFMEQGLSEFDWNQFDWTQSSMNMLFNRMYKMNTVFSPEHERDLYVADFFWGLCYSLNELLISFAARGIVSADLNISDIIGYARFDVRCRMKRYCEYEHLFDSFLEDYIRRIMSKVSASSRIKVNIVS